MIIIIRAPSAGISIILIDHDLPSPHYPCRMSEGTALTGLENCNIDLIGLERRPFETVRQV